MTEDMKDKFLRAMTAVLAVWALIALAQNINHAQSVQDGRDMQARVAYMLDHERGLR